MNRRGFLTGAGALLLAPAIVRASSLMPVRSMLVPIVTPLANDVPHVGGVRRLLRVEHQPLADGRTLYIADVELSGPPRLVGPPSGTYATIRDHVLTFAQAPEKGSVVAVHYAYFGAKR
jgi:hypothetical protein